MFRTFFLLGYEAYKFPSDFNSACPAGVSGGTNNEAYVKSNSSKTMSGTFCPTSNSNSVYIYTFADKIFYKIQGNNNVHSDSCDKDWASGCCRNGGTFTDFSSNRCYPFEAKLQANCGNEDDYMVIQNWGVRIGSNNAAYQCSYDNCHGYYAGDTCQIDVGEYTVGYDCDVSMGREGDGSCTCSGKTNMQDYCFKKETSNKNFKYYWRESNSGDWTEKGEWSSNSFSTNDENYYNQYKIAGKVQLRQKGVTYNFKLTTSTAATISVGSTSNKAGDSNYIYCDPSKSSSYYVSYTSTAIQKVNIEIIINTGCSLSEISVKLEWKKSSESSYYDITSDYMFH